MCEEGYASAGFAEEMEDATGLRPWRLHVICSCVFEYGVVCESELEAYMEVETIVVGSLMTNCYLISSDDGKEVIVIDPGEDASRILEVIDSKGLDVKYIVNTHGHYDHIGANDEIREKTGAKVCASPNDRLASVDKELKKGTKIKIDGIEAEVISTPGHSPGSISLMANDALFSGDLIFDGAVGRTDFPGGSVEKLRDSLEWLLTLSDDTDIYPGHGDAFNLGEQKKTNPFLLWVSGEDDENK